VLNMGAAGCCTGDVLTRGTRVSLTIRNVPRVRSLGRLLGIPRR